VQSVEELRAEVAESLEAIEDDFDAKRRLFETPDVWVTLVLEDGEKVVCAR
jgi:hypothetical protein